MMISLVLWQRTPIRHVLGDDRQALTTTLGRGPRRQRAGYTLLELVIVLAIIGVLAAVSIPALMRPWSRSKVQQAAQDLSSDLLKARLNAMQHGTPYQFRYRENTGEYEVVAWQDGSRQSDKWLEENRRDARSDSNQSTQTERDPKASNAQRAALDIRNDRSALTQERVASQPRREIGRLTNGAVFAPNGPIAWGQQDRRLRQTDSPQRSSAINDRLPSPLEGLAQPPNAHHRPWEDPIWFFPDGHSSTADLLLRDSEGYTVQVSLRGMTGTIRVGVVKKSELPKMPENGLPGTEADGQMPTSARQTTPAAKQTGIEP